MPAADCTSANCLPSWSRSGRHPIALMPELAAHWPVSHLRPCLAVQELGRPPAQPEPAQQLQVRAAPQPGAERAGLCWQHRHQKWVMHIAPTCGLGEAAGREMLVLQAMAGAYVMCAALCCRWQAEVDATIGNGERWCCLPYRGLLG